MLLHGATPVQCAVVGLGTMPKCPFVSRLLSLVTLGEMYVMYVPPASLPIGVVDVTCDVTPPTACSRA